MRAPRPAAELLAIVAARLARLPRRVVFVGGATTGLYITDPAAPEVRPTLDVDVVVDVGSYVEYETEVTRELRQLGASLDESPGAPRCRWVLDDVLVDVMAASEEVLGFTNCWYRAVLKRSREHTLANGATILVTTGPLFVATKVEAFRGRGGRDFRGSKDMEDIVAILDGRAELREEVAAESPELRAFLHEALHAWLQDRDFRDAVPGHLPGDPDSQGRASIVLERLEAILLALRE